MGAVLVTSGFGQHVHGHGELYSSVYSVMGKQFAASMIPVDYELNGIRIDGFTVKPRPL